MAKLIEFEEVWLDPSEVVGLRAYQHGQIGAIYIWFRNNEKPLDISVENFELALGQLRILAAKVNERRD